MKTKPAVKYAAPASATVDVHFTDGDYVVVGFDGAEVCVTAFDDNSADPYFRAASVDVAKGRLAVKEAVSAMRERDAAAARFERSQRLPRGYIASRMNRASDGKDSFWLVK